LLVFRKNNGLVVGQFKKTIGLSSPDKGGLWGRFCNGFVAGAAISWDCCTYGLVLVIFGAAPGDIMRNGLTMGCDQRTVRLVVLAVGLVIIGFVAYARLPTMPPFSARGA